MSVGAGSTSGPTSTEPVAYGLLAASRRRKSALHVLLMTWTVAMIIGPALSGLLIGNGLERLWVVFTVGGTAVAALLFLDLRRHLTRTQDGLEPEVVLAA